MPWHRKNLEEINTCRAEKEQCNRKQYTRTLIIIGSVGFGLLSLQHYSTNQDSRASYFLFLLLFISCVVFIFNNEKCYKLFRYFVNYFSFRATAERGALDARTEHLIYNSSQTNMICTKCHTIQSLSNDPTCKECGSPCDDPELWKWVEE